ncbi:hypothetical protein B0A49_10195 [Cryomyces minteri]|uniref:Uncharacterized protein n=1 Tax=Cryomyces minteri TaxID=331657 RepID=A0A4U0WLF9_9PEZI|nr:hypothetical protein B0A49_10195 [Cryomyces minteri]
MITITPDTCFVSHINKHASTKQLTADEVAKTWTAISVDSNITHHIVYTLIEHEMNGNLNTKSAIKASTKLALRERNAAREAARVAQLKKIRDKAQRAKAEWVEPAKHAGGAYEKVLKPGQRTRSGLAA